MKNKKKLYFDHEENCFKLIESNSLDQNNELEIIGQMKDTYKMIVPLEMMREVELRQGNCRMVAEIDNLLSAHKERIAELYNTLPSGRHSLSKEILES